MKKLALFGVFVAALAALNARIDGMRQCDCRSECWCQQPGLRHFRWLFPFGHHASSRS